MRRFGLIGYPLTHSFSPAYFQQKFRDLGITDAEYLLFPLKDIAEFPELLQREKNIAGLNVTIPYKETIISYLTSVHEEARKIGAVNTIRIESNGQLTGYNTDVFGFRQSIKPFLASRHHRALILGTGGASKAIAFALKEIGVEIVYVSREKKDIPGATVLQYADVNRYVMSSFLMIVNTTPLGMHPNTDSFPDIPYEYLTSEHYLFDAVYNPAETLFLKKGKEKGAMIQNGLDMLKLQAEKSWEIWNS
ncbi:MAG: shikimate dehydrogenase [Bacteroidia bacterium]